MTEFIMRKDAYLFTAPSWWSPPLGVVRLGTIFRGSVAEAGFIRTRIEEISHNEGYVYLTHAEALLSPDPITPDELGVFCTLVTSAARDGGTDRDYLMAVAYCGTENLTKLGDAGAKRVGPFQFNEEEWNSAITSGPAKDRPFLPEDRYRWTSQLEVAALLAAEYTGQLKADTALGRDPTFAELYFAQLFGPSADNILKRPRTDVCPEPAAGTYAADLALASGGVSIGNVLTNLQERLEAGFAEALKIIDEQPPEIRYARFLAASGEERIVPPRPYVQAEKADYLVWYATNRRPNDPRDSSKGYSAMRDAPGIVHYGSCRVYIPKSHKIGSTGSSWWKRLLTMTDDRLRLIAIDQTQQTVYWAGIAAQLAAIDAEERDALIFVHGYNVSFQEAGLRAAQIGVDLSVKGAMAFFSWPSQGSVSGYPADEATIEASEGVIADFMTDFAERSGASAVHIIAHSMGNRGVLRAVNRIAREAQQRTGKPFGQVMLAAADVDADVFRQLSAAYAEVAGRTTLYVSKRDLAVEAARWLHNFPRAGLMPPTLVLPGIDTINVTNVDLTMLGHGYVAEARDVLNDMHALITHGAPPNERFGLREAKNEEGEGYWLIGA